MGDSNPAGPSTAPLPPGWTSHISPAGRAYYHDSTSGVSTYTLPRPKPPKREKPVSKTLVPNTSGWFKVTTNKDNVFYFHPDTKTSEWLPPQEVASALKKVEEEEREKEERLRKQRDDEERAERERVKREKRERKRKLEEGVPITEFDASKRARPDGEDEDGEEEEGEEDEEGEEEIEDEEDDDQEGGLVGLRDDSTTSIAGAHADGTQQSTVEAPENHDDDDDDDQEWQRQIAEQMAAEAEAEAEAEGTSLPSAVADIVAPSTTLEDQKLAFLAHLTSLNTSHPINPMAPYDHSLPLFSTHPTFLSLPISAREDVFNEWCKLRIREKRASKAASSDKSNLPSFSSSANSNPFSTSAESSFRTLLKQQVTSTRTRFADFSSKFSRDPRYTRYGRADADREKLFKTHLVELGEAKRLAAKKAERGFLELLSDKVPGNYRGKVAAAGAEKDGVMEVWMQAKRTPGLVEDERYDAVGSSTRRFELFREWAKGEVRPSQSAQPHPDTSTPAQDDKEAKARAKQLALESALSARQTAVSLERSRLSRVNRSAYLSASRADSLLSFRQLLLDAIPSPHLDYDSSLPLITPDPRFSHPSLTDSDKRQLFSEHRSRLLDHESSKLGRIFARYAPSLDTHPDDILSRTREDPDLSSPGLNIYRQDASKLRTAFEAWNAQRQSTAEKEFKQMLHESSFVDFWGRLRKSCSQTTADHEKEEGEEGEEDGEVSLVEMARKVDLAEIEAVLRQDARFKAFKHAPEVRRKWIREHLIGLSAPSKSVHR
ncbi:hypothetical protein PHSY_001448 [Pseudozyma hubeiensis SY62]|uniref:WW domain-containing protein n=1 Tax=Pseudozyma hubeiensis (strain SY62) TaxID=1305764 RepID=R9NYV4_PSEHS|nr:hypothetical protein PHSY_001448 [Pseudozyma hubeiensis SY62]GAC93881.1 hypothetical protein PHSY_001448 [Pseudozyma hubeiensis SY62]